MSQKGLTAEIAELVAGDPDIRLALLFGSAAAGRLRPGSDVDVAVAAGGPLDSAAKTLLIEKLAALCGRAVDLVDLQTAEGLILAEVLTTGRLLLCRDHALYARLMRRMIFDREDMLPYQRRIQAVRRNLWTSR